MEDTKFNASLLEAQTANELNAEELEAVAGGWGWHEFTEGVRDFFQGTSDGENHIARSEDNLNYLGGHIIGSALGELGSLVRRG
jgi:hypothetical protein